MRILKKLLISILIVTILMPIIPVLPSYADEEDDEQKIWSDSSQYKYVETYIRAWIQSKDAQGNPLPVFYDKGGNGGRSFYQNNEAYSVDELANGNHQLVFNCAVFTSSMLYQSLGVDLHSYIDSCTAVSYSTGGKDRVFVELGGNDIIQPGDIIRTASNDHSLIYVGVGSNGQHQIADTNGKDVISIWDLPNVLNNKPLTATTLLQQKSKGGNSFAGVSRLKRDIVNEAWEEKGGVPDLIKIRWPKGIISEIDPNNIETGVTFERDDNAPLYYFGIATQIGSGGVTEHDFDDIFRDIINGFTKILHYAIGLVSMAIRIPIVGLARAAEMAISSALQAVSSDTTTYNITVEKIIFNKVPLFDFNIFDFNEAGGQSISSGSSQGADVILYLRENIAGWYIAFRNLTIVVMLAILIYLGIRMAITSIAEEKAHYKRMLADWFVSLFIVLFIHYFLVIVFTLNEYLVKLMYNQMQNATANEGIYESVRELAYGIKFTEGWYGTIMYVALIILMVKYAWKYSKRMLSGYILVMLSPLVAISYALDKIKDNRSQSISKWMKEVLYTVLIQSAHALIYLVFVSGIILPIASNSEGLIAIAGELVFLIVAVKFMDAAESIFRNIFGFESSSILKETMDSSFELFAKYKIVRDTVGIFRQGLHAGLRATSIVPRFMARHKDTGIPGVKQLNTFVSNRIDDVNAIKQGYKDGLNGKEITQTQGILGTTTKDMLYEIRNGRTKREQQAKANADTAWSSAKGAVRATALGIVNLPRNPKTAVLSLAAAGSYMRSTFRIAHRSFQNGELGIRRVANTPTTAGRMTLNNSQKGGIRELFYGRKKERLVFEFNEQGEKLIEQIDKASQNSSILVKGDRENATSAEKRNSKIFLNILVEQYHQRAKMIDSKSIGSAYDRMVMKTTTRDNSNLEQADLFNIIKIAAKGKNIDELSVNEETLPTDISNQKLIWSKLLGNAQTDEKLDTKKERFYENINLELQNMLVDKAMGRTTAITFKDGSEFESEFENRVQAIQEKVEALGLSDDKKAEALENAYNLEFGDLLNKEHNQVDILNSLKSEDIATIIMDSASKAEIDNSTENFRENTIKAVEAARADQTITWDSVLVEAERNNPNVKINKQTTKENLRKALEDAMMNVAFKKPESLNISFGKELGDKVQKGVEEYNKESSAYNSLAYSAQGKIKDAPGIEKLEDAIKEAEDNVRKSISDYLSDDENFNEMIMQVQQSPEGLTDLITRAVNDDGGIERDLEFRAKATYYDEAIKDVMTEKMPETLEELGELVKKVEENVKQRGTSDGRSTVFVPKFGENLDETLRNIGRVLSSDDAESEQQNTFLSKQTTTKVIEEIKKNKAKGKDAAEIVLKNMSPYEKKALFESQIYYKPTTRQMETEAKKFEPTFVVTENLRKKYIDTAGRVGIKSDAGVMNRATRNIYNRLK